MNAGEILPGKTLGTKKTVRKHGRIVAQRVIRQLPDGTLQSATYPLYAVQILEGMEAA